MGTRLQKTGTLFTFFSLYIAQKIPMSFFSTVLPVMMRQNHFSLEVIGLLQLLKLPWVLKFLWSPAVDRSCSKISDYKTWIFSSEIFYAVVIFAIAFLDLQTSPQLIIGLIVLAFIASATQDIATDALAIIVFNRKDKSMVNSMQAFGGFAGAMIGGGFLLMIYEGSGWNLLLPFLALFVLIAIIPLIFLKDKSIEYPVERKHKKPSPDDLLGFFKQKGIWKQLVFLFFFYAGMIGTLAMLKPMLVDYGYSMKEIGIIFGIIGTFFGCIGSLLAGPIVRRIGLHTARILFAGLIFISCIYFYLLLQVWEVNTGTLHFGIALLWLSYGMASIVVYNTAMECVRPNYEGTDFTIQTVITHLSGMLIAIASGKVAGELGYKNLFLIEAMIALFSFMYILTVFRTKKKKV